MRFSRLAAMAGASVLAVGIASCSSTGGKPHESGGGMGGGTVDTPRMTIAMITHEVPGDSFWDLIRKGAETAAQEGQHRAALFERSRGAQPGQPGADRDRQRRRRHRADAGQARRDARGRRGRRGQGHSGRGVQRRAATPGRRWASRSTSARTSSSPARPQATAQQDGAKKALCVIQEQGHVGLESRCAGVKSTSPATENLNVNGKDMPSVESTITAKLQQDPSIDYVVDAGRAVRADRCAVGQERGQQGQDRHLRHQRRAGRRDPGRRACSGPSTSSRSCRATWPIDSLWLYLNNGNVIGGGKPTLTGPGVHRQVQHRRRGRVREGRNPLMSTGTEVWTSPNARSSTTNASRSETAYSGC